MRCQFLFSLELTFSARKTRILQSIFSAKQGGLNNAYKLRVQDFATGKNFSFNQCSEQESFAFFLLKVFFIKAIENFFPMFAYPDINT